MKRLLLPMVFQKETGTLAHMTQGENWLSTVEKRFNLAFRLIKKSRISKVTGSELGDFTASKGSGGKTAKICLSRRYLATAIEKHGP